MEDNRSEALQKFRLSNEQLSEILELYYNAFKKQNSHDHTFNLNELVTYELFAREIERGIECKQDQK